MMYDVVISSKNLAKVNVLSNLVCKLDEYADV
jgi:hypothetical protein